MNFTLTNIFVLALAAAITSNGGAEGRSTHARSIRGRNLEQEDFFDDLYPFSLSMSMSMSLSLSMSMSMPMDEELLVSTTQVPPQEEGQVDIIISDNDGADEINMTNPDLFSPSADSSTTKTFIVTFADDDTTPPATRCDALAKSIGGTVDFVYSQVIKGCALTVPVAPQEDSALQQAEEVFTTLSESPGVMNVENDQIILLDPLVPTKNTELLSEMQVSAAATSWGLDRINQCKLPLNQKATKQDAKGVMVYILDTGIRGDHKEFKGQINSNDKCHFSAYAGTPALRDVIGHGTHVAGTACGATYGVSSNCRLCSVKIFNDSRISHTKDTLAGLDHVAATCGKSRCVVNMSMGGHYSAALNNAVANAVTKGIVVVVSAGNTGSDACALSPSSVPSAITVGSIDQFDKISAHLTGESPWASNFGLCVDVYAPGSFIKSAFMDSTGGSAIMSGTSMAAPHVTGIAAAIRSANKNWNPTQIRNAIVHSAVLLPSKLLLSTVDDIKCPASCPNGKSSVEIRTFTDVGPRQTAWILKNKNGTIIKKSPVYGTRGWFETAMCLSSGTYEFTITDKNCNGICCEYGYGEYIIRTRGRPVRSGGKFLTSEKVSFIV